MRGAGTRGIAGPLATGSQQVKDRVKDGAHVGRAWPPTRPDDRQVRGDPSPGCVVEVGVVASGTHRSRNRADELCFARGGSNSSNTLWDMQASSIESIRTVLANYRTSLSSVLGCFRTSILTVQKMAYAEFIGATAPNQHVVSLVVIAIL